jgi:3-dehydroquinate synthase II
VKILKKMVWIRADKKENEDERKLIATSSLENNFMNLIVRVEDEESFSKLGKFNLILNQNNELIVKDKICRFVTIENKEDEELAKSLANEADYIIVSTSNWKVIPLENLIAAFQNTQCKLLAEVDNVADAKLFFETLEVGVDGVVFNPQNPNDIVKLRKMIDEKESKNLDLVSATISKIKPLGSGDRVCIDSCSILEIGEGMLVGSQSNGLFLVHSESVESEYVAKRPFRVNAGSVHSYIMAAPNKTQYLSELTSGDEILTVKSTGETRKVVLGRVKIEVRPLVLVEAEYEGKMYGIILQNAETIRLVSEGKPVSVVDLAEGDSILMFIEKGGRHFGIKVDENIIEK